MNRRMGARLAAVAAGLLALTLAGSVSAREGRGRGPSPDRAVARLSERLSLTPAQQAEVKRVLESEAAERQKEREAHRTEREARRARTEEALGKVLSPEQREKLRALRDDRRGPRGGCRELRGDRREHRGDGPGAREDRYPRRGCRCDCRE